MVFLLLVYRLKYFSPPTDVRQHQAVSSKWSLPSRSVSALLKAPFADGQSPSCFQSHILTLQSLEKSGS